jgi:hypothetical protein
MLDSSMPSAMLEQEAQIFGFRDRTLLASENRSPQQTQIRENITTLFLVGPTFHWLFRNGCHMRLMIADFHRQDKIKFFGLVPQKNQGKLV